MRKAESVAALVTVQLQNNIIRAGKHTNKSVRDGLTTKATNKPKMLQGFDIANVLSSKGPVVKCVLLKSPPSDKDTKPADKTGTSKNTRPVLEHMIEEIKVDTTPSKSMVAKILGGPFTFLGQYEDEGIMLMIRKTEGVDPLDLPNYNPHSLQPPFDQSDVRGDILIIKVAPTDEVLDEEEGEENDEGAEKQVVVPTNDEFFLDYTKKEYVAFASRTDVVAPIPQEDGEEGGAVEEEDEDDDDEEYVLGEDEDLTEEESQVAVMNLVLRQVLRRFNEENGRGPTTEELLELRSSIAEKMGLPLPKIPNEAEQPPNKTKKRKLAKGGGKDGSLQSILTNKQASSGDEEEEYDDEVPAKRVKFGTAINADD